MNIYNGNVITDTEGNATVVLPDYFEALNRDFRYQLTVIGKFAQAAVAGEIKNNRFSVKTDQPNVKVSWQVTGIRNDALANAHFLTVEEEKPESQRGLFLNPEHYGQPKSKGIAFVHSLATEEPITGQANQISAS
jgi:trimeric autotransporter adhesin